MINFYQRLIWTKEITVTIRRIPAGQDLGPDVTPGADIATADGL